MVPSGGSNEEVGLKNRRGSCGHFVAQLGRMLFVVSSDTDDLGGLDGMNQCSFVEVEMVHAAAGQTFDVAIAHVRGLREKSG